MNVAINIGSKIKPLQHYKNFLCLCLKNARMIIRHLRKVQLAGNNRKIFTNSGEY